MPLLVGIDEAGYGPLLGPLVVAATVWRVPPPAAEVDFWEQLNTAVSRAASRRDSRLPVNDSKKIYDRHKGIATLERTVLAFAAALDLPHASLGEFVDALGPPLPPEARHLPWYGDLAQPLPLDATRSAHAAAATRLRQAMQTSNHQAIGLMAQLVTESAYNDRVHHTHNKAAVLLEQVLRLILRCTAATGDQDVCVHVDRLGGRQDYRPVLQEAFPDRHLHIEEMSDERSRYRLSTARSDWYIDFVVDADQHHLPVALASMLAKYVREVVMTRLNAFWQGLLPGLKPTAGYYKDALRYLADIEPLLGQAGLGRGDFVRER
ncbi:MAG: hypothetical protein PVJ57_11095 [Phycisphaerae bacterium]